MKTITWLFGWTMSFVALYFSWDLNHSVLWGILHFFLGTFYVAYHFAGWSGAFAVLAILFIRQLITYLLTPPALRGLL